MYKVYFVWANGKTEIGVYNNVTDAFSYMIEVKKYLYRLRKYYIYDLKDEIETYTNNVLKNAPILLNNDVIDLLKSDVMRQYPDVIVE